MTGQRMTALLVEDNPGDARFLRELLAESGGDAQLELVHVSTLAQALERLNGDDIDVVLLDLSLPDGHGLETVARTTAAAPGIPIVVLTGLMDEMVAIRAVQEGAQ